MVKAEYLDYIKWIDSRWNWQKETLLKWSEINSGSYNLQGIEQFTEEVKKPFQTLDVETRLVEVPPQKTINDIGELELKPLAPCLSLRKKKSNPNHRIFLFGHLDTVFAKEHSFQKVSELSEDSWQGPGVSDLKGGILVLLVALEAFERSPYSENVSWEVFLNSDEEIGSPGSKSYFESLKGNFDIGLGFEPSLPDGNWVANRKGSGNFSIVVKGKPSHVGREFHLGRSAMHAVSRFVHEMVQWSKNEEGVIFNVGKIEGGGPANVVSPLGIARYNIRLNNSDQQKKVEKFVSDLVTTIKNDDEVEMEILGEFAAPPKKFDGPTQMLAEQLQQCGNDLNETISWRDSGGVCDGNRVAAAGIPNLDTLGVVGGNIHTEKEYINLDSLKDRAKLVSLFLMKLGSENL